jgi:ankyrin repeat protein
MRIHWLAAWGGVVLAGVLGCGQTAEPSKPKEQPYTPREEGPRNVAADAGRQPGYTERLAALKEAVQKGRVSEVRELLKNRLDVNDKDDAGQTPLMWAAAKGHMAIVWLLLSQGALAEERDAQGRNALMHAAEASQSEVVQALLAPQRALDAGGAAALKLAGVDGKLGFTGVAGSINERDGKGLTALMLAARTGSKETVESLSTADIAARDGQGQTALMMAAAGGHRDVVSVLLRQKFQRQLQAGLEHLRLKDRQGQTAANLARTGGHLDLADYLEDFARDPHALDEQGLTALNRAIDKGDRKKAQELLERGVDPYHADAQGRTAAVLAAVKGDAETLSLIGSLQGFKSMVEYMNLADKQGMTALMHAAALGHAHCVQALVGNGSQVYGRDGFDVYVIALTEASDKEGHNALMLAAARGHAQAVRSLLQAFGDSAVASLPGPERRRACVQSADKGGKTALQLAQDAEHVAVVRVLKEFGAQ